MGIYLLALLKGEPKRETLILNTCGAYFQGMSASYPILANILFRRLRPKSLHTLSLLATYPE